VVLARYRDVLREPYVGRLLVTSILARLPQGMSSLAVLLFLTPRLGYARAGVATGVSVATAGLSNVLLARGVDRSGARIVLVPAAAAYAAAMIALGASGHAAYAVQLALCAAIGLATPPITAVARGMWPRLLGEAAAQTIYGLEATAQELIYIAGPATVALVAGIAGARTALVTSGLVGLVGAVAYVSAPPFARAAEARPTTRRRWPSPAVLRYALVGVCLTTGFNMTDISTVNFVSGRHASAAAGIVLAVWSLGSLLGGLRFGAGAGRVTDRTLMATAAVAAAGTALAAAAPDAVGLAALLFLAGAAVAPTLARLYTRMGTAAGETSTTEAFGWLAVGFLAGSSSGSAIGGALVASLGSRWTFVLAGAAVLCTAPVLAVRR
jgi:MFS family permease